MRNCAIALASAVLLTGCSEFGDAMQGFARALAILIIVFIVVLALLAAAELAAVVCVVVGVLRNRRTMLAVGAGLALFTCSLHTMGAVARTEPFRPFDRWLLRLAVIPPATLVTAIVALTGRRRGAGGENWAAFVAGGAVLGGASGLVQLHLAKFSDAAVATKGVIVAGAVGYGHACYRTDLGEVSCEGSTSFGETGGNKVLERRTPSRVPGLEGMSTVGVGDQFSCALAQGGVRCWGELRRLVDSDPSAALDRWTPTPVPDSTGATAMYARSGRLVVITPRAARIYDKTYDRRGEIPLPDGTEEIALSSSVLCARDHAGRVRCRDTEERGGVIVTKGEEVALEADDVVAMAGEDHVLCIERRTARIECIDVHRWVDREGKLRDFDPKRPIVRLDATRPAIGPGRIVCGVRSDALVCARTRPIDIMNDVPPPVRELRLPSPASATFGGYAGLCAVLADHSLTCLKHDDPCIEHWADGRDGCAPKLAPSPITYDSP